MPGAAHLFFPWYIEKRNATNYFLCANRRRLFHTSNNSEKQKLFGENEGNELYAPSKKKLEVKCMLTKGTESVLVRSRKALRVAFI